MPGVGESLQQLFHNDDIDPAIIEHALLVVNAHCLETMTLIQAHTWCIGGEGCQYHLVISKPARALLQCTQQCISYPSPPLFSRDIDGEIHYMIIGWARIEGIERAPPYNCPCALHRDQYRMPGTTYSQPFAPLFLCAQLCLQCGCPILNP